jgi:hypothetical protein
VDDLRWIEGRNQLAALHNQFLRNS